MADDSVFEYLKIPLEVIQENYSLLSRRECEILTLYNRGLSMHQIAECQGIAPNTVRVHIQSIRNKLKLVRRRKNDVPPGY